MNNKWKSYRSTPEKEALQGCEPGSLSPEETLYLALHVRGRFLDRISAATDEEEQLHWVDAIAAAYGSLLAHCDLDDMDRVYQKAGAWHQFVQPPSVLAGELMMFLGGLSVDNAKVFKGCRSRGSIQAFLQLQPRQIEHFEVGAEKRSRPM